MLAFQSFAEAMAAESIILSFTGPTVHQATCLQMWGGSLAAAAAGIGLLLLVFGDRLPWARRQRKGGRWVADRALGGREVSQHTMGMEPRVLDICNKCLGIAAAAISQQPGSRLGIQTSEPALASAGLDTRCRHLSI